MAGAVIGIAISLFGAYSASRAASAQNAIVKDQEKDARFFRDIWMNWYRQCEINHLYDVQMRGREVAKPAATRARMAVSVRRAFSTTRQKAVSCSPIMCVGARRTALMQLAIAEAKSIAEIADRAERHEDTRTQLLNSQLDDLRYRNAQLGRNLIMSVTNAAQSAAALTSNIAAGSGQIAGYALARGMRMIGDSVGGQRSRIDVSDNGYVMGGP